MSYAGDEYYGDEITSPLVRPMPTTRHIASYLNQRGNIEVTVTRLVSGNYSVRVHDIDAEMTLPASRHFKDVEAARAYALKCAADGHTDDLPL